MLEVRDLHSGYGEAQVVRGVSLDVGPGEVVALLGRNGEGDPYYTDGEIDVASLVIDGVKRTEPPETLPPPPLIALKDQIWHGVSNAVSP